VLLEVSHLAFPVGVPFGTAVRWGSTVREEAIMGTILIDKLLSAQVKQNASDLHITVGQPPVLRLHGRMQKLKTKVLEPSDTMGLMKSITPDRCQQEFQETGSTDFGFAFGDLARFRVSVFRQRGHVAMVLRQIPVELMSMDQLSVPPIFKEMIMRPRGLILVTGPTGSGKSTSLAAMIDYLNDTVDHHIITVEDPIEFYHNHDRRRRAVVAAFEGGRNVRADSRDRSGDDWKHGAGLR